MHIEQSETLRAAAHAREWTALQATLVDVLKLLGTYPALEVVVNRLYEYLPTFQRHHPDDTVLKQLLVAVVSFGFAPDQLPDHIVASYSTPGNGQYANAILEMCRAMQRERDPQERFVLLTSAVANSIIAEMAEYWYTRNPEAYARVRANRFDPATGEFTDPEAARIPLLMWMDEGVAALDTGAWSAIADAVEKKLSEGNL